MPHRSQPWLYSPWVDTLFILSPPFLCLLAVVCFPGFFQQHVTTLPVPAWVILILLIDVGHVYSTLFRTYLEKETLKQKKQLLLWVPIGAWVSGVLLYSFSDGAFWRVLAYLAVFHFVRQQYGFKQLYSRADSRPAWENKVDTVCVYLATILPLLYWHVEGNRNFNWFIDHDFVLLGFGPAAPVLKGSTLALFGLYLIKEGYVYLERRSFNVPRHLIITGTFLAWYVGIIHFNGDLIFTTFNVVSHGIPYLALVWIYNKKKKAKTPLSTVLSPAQRLFLKLLSGVFFIGLVVVLAYIEEGLWDALVWRDHPQVFSFFQGLPQLQDHLVLSFLVPLLALPQMTHYLLDGFIWKVSRPQG